MQYKTIQKIRHPFIFDIAMPNRPLSDFEIEKINMVHRCQAGDPKAWEELYDQYYYKITKAIEFSLRRKGRYDLLKAEDAIGDIFVSSLIKSQKNIRKLKDPLDIRPWLIRIAINATIDYLKNLSTREKSRLHVIQKSTDSLSRPVSDETDTTLEETIADNAPNHIFREPLEEIIEEIRALPEKAQWTFRLKLIFYNPFTDAEIRKLSDFLGNSFEEAHALIHCLMDGLTRIAVEKEEALSDAAMVESEMEKLEYRLKERKKAFAKQWELDFYKEKAAAKAKRMSKLETTGQQHIDPSNGQIAAIMGITKNNVSLYVHRIRKILKHGDGYQTYLICKKNNVERNILP